MGEIWRNVPEMGLLIFDQLKGCWFSAKTLSSSSDIRELCSCLWSKVQFMTKPIFRMEIFVETVWHTCSWWLAPKNNLHIFIVDVPRKMVDIGIGYPNRVSPTVVGGCNVPIREIYDGLRQWEEYDIPYMKWKIKFMFETTNQPCCCYFIAHLWNSNDTPIMHLK